MKKNRLGKSSIVVSDICMGTMTFGNQANEKASFRIMDMAYDAGVDFYDTAEMYPVPPDAKYVGATEEIVGNADEPVCRFEARPPLAPEPRGRR